MAKIEWRTAAFLFLTALEVKVLRGFDVDVRRRIAGADDADAALPRQQVATKLLAILLVTPVRVLLALRVV